MLQGLRGLVAAEGRPLALFVLLLWCYSYFFPRWSDWNQNSRFDLVLALVEEGTVTIDGRVANTGDYAYYAGHYYSDKAPGMALLGVPVYAAFRALAPASVIGRAAASVGGNPALEATLRPDGTGLREDKALFFVGLVATTFATVAVPSAALGVLFFKAALRFGCTHGQALASTLLYALGTNAFPYSNAFVGHQLSAFLLFTAFFLLHSLRRGAPPRFRLVAVGFLLGYAAITEYPTAVVGALLGLYAMPILKRRAEVVARLAVGALPPLVALAVYDYAAFGTPLPVGYSYSSLWTEVHQTGLLSLTFPQPEPLWGLTFGVHRGLFFLSPFLLLALPGYLGLWRDAGRRTEFWVLLLAPLSLLLIYGSSAMWQGGFAVGPRYLVPALPFLALPAAVGLARLSRRRLFQPVLLMACGWSIFAVWAESIGGQSFPDYTPNPLFGLSLPRLAEGDVARNLGMLLGLSGWASLLPLVLVALPAALAAVGRPSTTAHASGLSGASEWRFVAAMSALLLSAASLPTLFGYLVEPPGEWFSGVAGNVHDAAQYLSWMRESGQRVFIENKLTSEPNPAVFLNLHWWIPGRVAAVAGLTPIQGFHLLGLVSIPLYVAVAYWFYGLLYEDRSRRRFAFLLATFTSGAGWIWVVDKYLNGRADALHPLDLYATPGNTLQVATTAPHQTLALALMLAVLGLAWLGHERKRWRSTAAASLLALFLGFGHIYDLVTVWVVLGAFGLLATLRNGFSWGGFARLFTVVAASAPAPLYFGWLSSGANPTWSRALAQYDNLGVHTPSPPHLVVLLGLTFVAALLTFVRTLGPLGGQSHRDLLLKGWFAANLVIIYLPVRFEIMLLAGFQIVMAALATDGLYGRLIPWAARRLESLGAVDGARIVRFVPVLFLLLVLPTNLYLLAWRMNDLSRDEYPFYLNRGDVAAMQWLDENSEPDDVVLSSMETGHFIPGLAGNRAFISNAVMTLDFHAKRALVERFFDEAQSDQWRLAFLQEHRVAYLFYGPAERRIGSYDPTASPLFTVAFSAGPTRVLRVNR